MSGAGSSETAEAVQVSERLAELLGFAVTSKVGVAGWDHAVGNPTSTRVSTIGTINDFLPVVDTSDGAAMREFLELSWEGYKHERNRRNLPAVFHYLALAEREGTPVELKLAILSIILEQLKHSFAVSHGYVFYPPFFHIPGTLKPTRHTKRGFQALLGEMFATKAMSPSLSAIVDLRNEILHSGLSALPFATLWSMQGEILALIREYILRLLGYTGTFFTGQSGGLRAVIR